MVNTEDFLNRAEEEIRTTRGISQGLCDDFFKLPLESQAAFARALAWAGCSDVTPPPSLADVPVPEVDRLRAAQWMLLGFSVDTDNPRWSSWALDRMWDAIIAVSGSSVTDLYHAYFNLLDDFPHPITEVMTYLVHDIVIRFVF